MNCEITKFKDHQEENSQRETDNMTKELWNNESQNIDKF